ncbi:hypothetical protein PsYK624_154210 [Phanerochaete sordida]|uniref:Uncharacterized protein n=1 Tax=Phanerochaete sordida TaxID=48140 RepID=A0A9P3GQD7_9APHY|nr:hypothetical protein PsYK624_154210 [Phanerochaete sordida]
MFPDRCTPFARSLRRACAAERLRYLPTRWKTRVRGHLRMDTPTYRQHQPPLKVQTAPFPASTRWAREGMRYRVYSALQRHGAVDERGQFAPTSTARGCVRARDARRGSVLGKDEDPRSLSSRMPHTHERVPCARLSATHLLLQRPPALARDDENCTVALREAMLLDQAVLRPAGTLPGMGVDDGASRIQPRPFAQRSSHTYAKGAVFCCIIFVLNGTMIRIGRAIAHLWAGAFGYESRSAPAVAAVCALCAHGAHLQSQGGPPSKICCSRWTRMGSCADRSCVSVARRSVARRSPADFHLESFDVDRVSGSTHSQLTAKVAVSAPWPSKLDCAFGLHDVCPMDPPRLPVDYTTRVRAVSAAQRFPIETVTRIMKHLPSFITWGYNGWKSREEKRFLGQCSLVCTYWAIHLRPEIFSNLVIRTRNDAECLLEFVKVTTLGASIGHYLKDLRVEWSIPSSYPPWAHLVLHLLPLNLFPLKPIIAMVVSKDNSGDPTRDALISPPSPFHDLPRTLPFPASYNVEDIFVQNLHFGSLANLVSFAISALNIKRDRSWLRCTLYLDSSTWSEDVQEAHTPFPNHMLHCLNERHKHLTLCVKARSVPWQYMHSWLSYVSASIFRMQTSFAELGRCCRHYPSTTKLGTSESGTTPTH